VLQPEQYLAAASARTGAPVLHLAEIRRAGRSRRARLQRVALVAAVGGSTAVLGARSMPAAVLAAPALTTVVARTFVTPRRAPSLPIPRRALLVVTAADLVVAARPRRPGEHLGRLALRLPRAGVARVGPGDRADDVRIECTDGTCLTVIVTSGDRTDLLDAIGRSAPHGLRNTGPVSPAPVDGRRTLDRLP
jgi:hypothetical protein